MENDRPLSSRELEQQELEAQRCQQAVDSVDEHWPEIMKAAAYVKDCHTALVKMDIPAGVAYGLIPSMMRYLLRSK